MTNDIRLYSLETDLRIRTWAIFTAGGPKKKGNRPKGPKWKRKWNPKPYMESDQVVGNRLLFSFLGRARILAGPGWRPRRLEWGGGGGGSLWAQTNELETSAAPGFSPVSGQQHQANTSLTAAGRLNQEKRRWLFERLPYAWPQLANVLHMHTAILSGTFWRCGPSHHSEHTE